MARALFLIVTIALVAGCSGGGRFAGFNNCSADGSTVMVEYPNQAGTYDGLNNGPCK
jgi:hypothetical protein